MSHRVIQFQTKVSSKSKTSELKQKIENRLDNKEFNLFERSVVDGEDMDGIPTLSVTTEHNVSEEANQFSTWLKQLAEDNKANSNSEGFNWLRHKVHDCWHNVEGQQEPCEAQDYKSFDI